LRRLFSGSSTFCSTVFKPAGVQALKRRDSGNVPFVGTDGRNVSKGQVDKVVVRVQRSPDAVHDRAVGVVGCSTSHQDVAAPTGAWEVQPCQGRAKAFPMGKLWQGGVPRVRQSPSSRPRQAAPADRQHRCSCRHHFHGSGRQSPYPSCRADTPHQRRAVFGISVLDLGFSLDLGFGQNALTLGRPLERFAAILNSTPKAADRCCSAPHCYKSASRGQRNADVADGVRMHHWPKPTSVGEE